MRRRSFLKTSLVGGAVLVGGSGAIALWPSELREAPEGLRALSHEEYSVLAAVAARICPGDEDAPSADDTRVAELLDAELPFHDRDVIEEIKQLLGIFESGLFGAVFGEHVRPFTRLAPEDQDAVLAEWRDSAVTIRRTGFEVLHGLITATHFGQSATWTRTGYPGPPSPDGLRDAYAEHLVDLPGLLAPDEPGAGAPEGPP